jgi:C-terminal processing protease CtpA/Prc
LSAVGWGIDVGGADDKRTDKMKKTTTKLAIALAGGLALAAVLPAAPATAGGKKGSKSTTYSYSTGEKDGGARIVVRPSDGAVVVLAEGDGGESHSIRLEVQDGRMHMTTSADDERPWLGVLVEAEEPGIRVKSVMDDSPAQRAGLQSGDLIIEVNDRDLSGDESRGLLHEASRATRSASW